ncbi:MAG TPA: sigma-54 dependent transcriptional regulator [Kofleriaceae bacterium]|nr:sigma-54 dependent transcriptional regulator [Kofleriaceae bacterium]
MLSDPALALVTDLLAASGSADTQRAMVRALGEVLVRHVAVARVRLESTDGAVAAEWSAHGAPARLAPVALAAGLTIWPRGPMPLALRAPDTRAALAEVVRAALRHLTVVRRVADLSRRAHAENRALRAEVGRLTAPGTLVARSQAMREVLARVELVARHATTVLLTGESGSGKEVVAREIHRRSRRAHRPFLHINCGAIAAGLVESELFGHERGAFTGADRQHRGVFERAHGGTLLLDEVGELPPEAQVKLLRVVQERTVQRVGGHEVVPVDVRLIAATNRSLADQVRAGRFREDLYYRLDVFAIALPPLRERRADLAPLVAQLVGQLADRLHMAAPPISRATLRRLAAHDWPGNVRELANVLEAALILGRGRTLALPHDLGERLAPAAPATGATFAAATRAAIEHALRASRGAIYGPRGAAHQLALKPATLQSKMKKLGIRRADFT